MKKAKVRFLVTDLVDASSEHQLRFKVLLPKSVPKISVRAGEKTQIGYRSKREVTYDSSEREKDAFIFEKTKLEEVDVLPKRNAFWIKQNEYRMGLKPNENHLFYLEDVARVILDSGGRVLVKLPALDTRYEKRQAKRSRSQFEVSYRNARLERVLQER